jgi:transcriptional regulator with XRE-family HTH domain
MVRGVNGRRVAAVLRAVRLHLGLRQRDVAEAAGVSQSAVSRAERDRLDELCGDQLDRIAKVLRVGLFLDARWLDGDVDRLIDSVHAAIVEAVVGTLERDGWIVVVEYGFNHYGDRGSVDVLAWHPKERTLLIIEVKSRLTDLQATFSSFARKLRIVPRLVARERGWDAKHIGRIIVMPGTTANRTIVSRHAAMFATLFPERMPAIGRWLRRPDRDLGGLWYLSAMHRATRKRARRVRCRRSGPLDRPQGGPTSVGRPASAGGLAAHAPPDRRNLA